MRQRRALLGMSQEKLGTAVGRTFQHIQKYERGSNRIGSSRLFEFAKVLDVPVSYFFDAMPSKNALAGRPMSGSGRKGGFGEAATPFEQAKDPLIKRETLELCRPTTRSAKAACASASSRWSRRSVPPAMPRCLNGRSVASQFRTLASEKRDSKEVNDWRVCKFHDYHYRISFTRRDVQGHHSDRGRKLPPTSSR
jgi:transcriptional regulator with XRE-family HTH domain